MRLAIGLLVTLTLAGCRNYRATDVSSPPKGLSAYQRAAIHTSLARGVEASVEEVALFETDIEKRIKGEVVPDAVHGPGTTGDLVVNVTLTKLEAKEGGSLVNPRHWTECSADVELVDANGARGLGRFIVNATDNETIPGLGNASPNERALANVAKGIAAKIRASR
jgi:hypothetical protein